eukprot:SAG11_NODE_17261_length_523_cov_1.514151_1_plen_26_part_10
MEHETYQQNIITDIRGQKQRFWDKVI